MKGVLNPGIKQKKKIIYMFGWKLIIFQGREVSSTWKIILES